MAKIIDGKKVSADVKARIAKEVEAIRFEGKRAPGLAVVIVGDDSASRVYVNDRDRAPG